MKAFILNANVFQYCSFLVHLVLVVNYFLVNCFVRQLSFQLSSYLSNFVDYESCFFFVVCLN
uniref:Uncharacterized protein n=1 Tax=Cannabis sativa TaxID=3483 RepID=A0A803QYY5_CANSA